MKRCPKCNAKKDISCFGIRWMGKRNKNKPVFRSYCTECERDQKRNYDKKNKEKIRILSREYYKKNTKKECLRNQKYRNDNKEKIKEYYIKNKNKRLVRQRERMDNEPKFRLRRSVSACIRERLYSRKISKNYKKTFSFLPYTIDELVKHLESLFKPGMTWNNYGKWHIDHVIPDSFFKYRSVDDKEFKKCWSLTNLQPLWAKENLKKSNKII